MNLTKWQITMRSTISLLTRPFQPWTKANCKKELTWTCWVSWPSVKRATRNLWRGDHAWLTFWKHLKRSPVSWMKEMESIWSTWTIPKLLTRFLIGGLLQNFSPGSKEDECLGGSDFLIGRKQQVTVVNAESNWTDVISGVPQGSVFGPRPILFVRHLHKWPAREYGVQSEDPVFNEI